HPADRRRVLFELTAEALAARLRDAVLKGLSPARLAFDPDKVDAEWLTWHTAAASEREAPTQVRQRSKDSPLVSVCLVHHDRPHHLKQALASLRAQDYPSIQVVLVDDGSTQPEAVAALEKLAPEFRRRGWSIVRQPNRYLGAARNTAIQHAKGRYVL